MNSSRSLTIACQLLTHGTVYQDLRGNYFDERDEAAAVKRAMARFRRLGYEVTVTPNPPRERFRASRSRPKRPV